MLALLERPAALGLNAHRPLDAPICIVARGRDDLVSELEAIFAGSVRVVENRRRDPALLPREGREGRRYLAPALAA